MLTIYCEQCIILIVEASSQIAINQTKLEIETKNYDTAIKTMKRNIRILTQYNKDYLNEAYYSLSYIYYKCGKYIEAIDSGIIAIKEQSHVGNIIGANTAKEIVASSLAKLGSLSKAEDILKKRDSDPLGIEDYEQYRITSKEY